MLNIKVISDVNHKAESYLYWIKTPDMKDISKEGYVGVTCDLRKRLAQHKNKLKNGGSYYHGGFRKQFNLGNLEVVIVDCGHSEEIYHKEFLLRPNIGIGWNYAIGGVEAGLSCRDFEIAGLRFSYRKACEILGLSNDMVQKRLNCYNASVDEAFGLTTKVDHGKWCNYPTRTGYKRFLFPLCQIESWSKEAYILHKKGMNLGSIEKEIGCPQSIVKSLLKIDYNITFDTTILNICVDDIWFNIKTTLTPDDVYHIIQMYKRRLSVLEISKIYSIPERTVNEIVKKWVLAGGESIVPKYKLYYNTDVDEPTVKRTMLLKFEGYKNTEVASMLGVTPSFVSRSFKALSGVYEECFGEAVS